MLLEAHADPNTVDTGGRRPLDFANDKTDKEILRLFEKYGGTASPPGTRFRNLFGC